MERASRLLEKDLSTDPDTYMKIEEALKRSSLRLKSAQQYRKSGQRSRPPGMGTSK